MIPVGFDYVRPDVAGRGARAARPSTARTPSVLAGGHSLLPMMKLRLAAPELLIDIGRLGRAAVRAGRRRRGRDRRGHPAHHDWRRRSARRRGAAAAGRRADGRRPAGAPPRHARRLARPRRPGLRPARRGARAWTGRSCVRGPRGERRVPADRLLHRRVRDRDGARRAARRGAGAADRRRRAGRTRSSPGGRTTGRSSPSRWSTGGSGWSTWARRRCGRPRPRPRSPAGASIEEAAALADEGTDPPSRPRRHPEYRRHLARRAHPPRADDRGGLTRARRVWARCRPGAR